jgi:hypothetical protein
MEREEIMNVEEFLYGIPYGDPDCPMCGGSGWLQDEEEMGGGVERCVECMPPSLVLGPNGSFRQGSREEDCEFIGRWRRL